MDYLKKYQGKEGLVNVVAEKDNGLKRAVFSLLTLKKGEEHTQETKQSEYGLIILSGTCDIEGEQFKYARVGKRKNVFSGKPSAVYVPINTQFTIRSITDDLEIALCSAECGMKTKPALISPDDVTEYNLGALNWKRKAYFIIDDKIESENFFIGETFLSPGKWAFPPHRHDYGNYPIEVEMDEIYHYRTDPANGFGVQLSYTDDKSRDDSYTVRNGDTVVFPDGYHPAGASPADSLYILWFLAGKERFFLSKPDEQYDWIKNCENLVQ